MKSILMKIGMILKEMPFMNKNLMLAIITPLKTEQQATTMLKWLEENKDNKELMREDKILKKALEISEY